MKPVPNYFTIVFEDPLSEAVIERLCALCKERIVIHRRMHARGCGYIRSRIRELNAAAMHNPYLILLDSDDHHCALTLLESLMPPPVRSKRCLFRIAVHEIEAWLVADAKGIAAFLAVSTALVPKNPESVVDPKAAIVALASRSRKRQIREGLAPARGTTAKVGPEYNLLLIDFVLNKWDIVTASRHSESLHRAIRAVKSFKY